VLPDLLKPGLLVVFVGTAVSPVSARRGHYYSSPNNKFWDLLAATGLVGGERLGPEDGARLPSLGVGLTDLAKGRAEASEARLRPDDFDVPALLEKIEACRPRHVAFNGSKACELVARHLGEVPPEPGPASWTIAGARAYRLPSSSGAAAIGTEAKRRAWAEFGEWVRGQEGSDPRHELGDDAEDADYPEPEQLPDVFELEVGGYTGDSFRVRLEGAELVYEHMRDGYEPYRTVRVRPDSAAWERFGRWLEVVDPWAWNGEYRLPPEQVVTDGTHWRLRLVWVGQVQADGDNAYPPYGDGPEGSPHWDIFCVAVRRLLGDLPFA
jgi:TDG/mug DNA glycosylase family protein